MERAIEDLSDAANVEVAIRAEGRSMVMVLAAKPVTKSKERGSKPDAEDQDSQRSGEEVQAN
jgi:hypothetical protein